MTETDQHDTTTASAAVLVERDGPVAVVRLNRPAARNAVNVDLATALVEAMERTADARCIVVTGEGPAFCAGLDLRNLGTDRLADLPPFIEAVRRSPVPTIAAVNGPAVTGGFEVALACDFMVASTNAAFADTHLRVGVYPGPVLVDLPRRVGMAKARELSLTGNFVDAAEAARIGLVNHVVEPDALMDAALGLAHAIAEQDPAMVATMRRDWDDTGSLPYADAHRRHRENAVAAGFADAGSDTLRSNMAAVVDRSRTQRAPRD
ncbi:MAG: enoyl-CoA hydratase-related protein [Actinomycetota bacterium]|nr:enoyl-CoA hydratase-related protein [Actinomycetota bacterium]